MNRNGPWRGPGTRAGELPQACVTTRINIVRECTRSQALDIATCHGCTQGHTGSLGMQWRRRSITIFGDILEGRLMLSSMRF